MNVTASFDMREVSAALNAYMSHSNRAPEAILYKQATQLAIGAKGVKGLYQEALTHRPEVIREIRALPKRLGHRIKRESGSVRAEIARRTVQAGRFQASGWITEAMPNPRGAVVRTVRGKITMRGGANARVTLSNRSPQALEFGSRTGYIQRALNNRARDMRRYVEKKLASDARQLSSRRPRFTPISELMRP